MQHRKFHGDVRPLSHDTRYMGVAFNGAMDNAIKQARRAIDHGIPVLPIAAQRYRVKHLLSRDRVALLQHLNLVPL